MALPKLRGLLYGHGHMGAHHARRLAERGDVALTVVDPPKGLPAPARPRADFAIVASPTATHLGVALPLLESGIPCLVEKPLASDLDEARILAAFPHLSVGFVERFNPALDPLKGARPRWIQAERLAPFHGRGAEIDVLDDLMIHDLDLARLLLGPELYEIRAMGVGVLGGRADIVNARLELGGPDLQGAALLTASRVSRRSSRSLRLVAEGLYWSLDLLARTTTCVRWGEGDLSGEPLPIPDEDPLSREHTAFLSAVRGQSPFPIPGTEAVAAREMAAAIRAAISAQRSTLS